MRVALIGGKEALTSNFRESAARAGFDLWFLHEPTLAMASRIAELDALVISSSASAREREAAISIANATCIPAYCATCEGAALCGFSRTHSLEQQQEVP